MEIFSIVVLSLFGAGCIFFIGLWINEAINGNGNIFF